MSPHNHKPALKLRARLRKTQFNKRSRSISIARGASPHSRNNKVPRKASDPRTRTQKGTRPTKEPTEPAPNPRSLHQEFTQRCPERGPIRAGLASSGSSDRMTRWREGERVLEREGKDPNRVVMATTTRRSSFECGDVIRFLVCFLPSLKITSRNFPQYFLE